MQYIGRIDKSKFGEYEKQLTTDIVILTEERKNHIKANHRKDFDKILINIRKVILNPSEILEDKKNKDTVFFIGKLDKDNLNVIVKLNTTNSDIHPKNSVMTAWIIRNSNLKKLQLV